MINGEFLWAESQFRLVRWAAAGQTLIVMSRLSTQSVSSGTLRTLLLFPGVRRFVYLEQRGVGRRVELV